MNHTNSLQVPVTKRYKQALCHSTDYNTSLFSLIAKFYDLSDLRRVRTAWLRLLHSDTNDGWLSPFTVCCFGTNSTCISLPHHTESIILQQTLIDIPSWLLRWLTRFVLTTAYNCYIQNVHYETLSVKTMYIKYLKYYS